MIIVIISALLQAEDGSSEQLLAKFLATSCSEETNKSSERTVPMSIGTAIHLTAAEQNVIHNTRVWLRGGSVGRTAQAFIDATNGFDGPKKFDLRLIFALYFILAGETREVMDYRNLFNGLLRLNEQKYPGATIAWKQRLATLMAEQRIRWASPKLPPASASWRIDDNGEMTLKEQT